MEIAKLIMWTPPLDKIQYAIMAEILNKMVNGLSVPLTQSEVRSMKIIKLVLKYYINVIMWNLCRLSIMSFISDTPPPEYEEAIRMPIFQPGYSNENMFS